MKNRRERRKESRESKVAFEPQYNGNQPVTYEEFHAKGYERFNSKYITIKEVEDKE